MLEHSSRLRFAGKALHKTREFSVVEWVTLCTRMLLALRAILTSCCFALFLVPTIILPFLQVSLSSQNGNGQYAATPGTNCRHSLRPSEQVQGSRINHSFPLAIVSILKISALPLPQLHAIFSRKNYAVSRSCSRWSRSGIAYRITRSWSSKIGSNGNAHVQYP